MDKVLASRGSCDLALVRTWIGCLPIEHEQEEMDAVAAKMLALLAKESWQVFVEQEEHDIVREKVVWVLLRLLAALRERMTSYERGNR